MADSYTNLHGVHRRDSACNASQCKCLVHDENWQEKQQSVTWRMNDLWFKVSVRMYLLKLLPSELRPDTATPR